MTYSGLFSSLCCAVNSPCRIVWFSMLCCTLLILDYFFLYVVLYNIHSGLFFFPLSWCTLLTLKCFILYVVLFVIYCFIIYVVLHVTYSGLLYYLCRDVCYLHGTVLLSILCSNLLTQDSFILYVVLYILTMICFIIYVVLYITYPELFYSLCRVLCYLLWTFLFYTVCHAVCHAF